MLLLQILFFRILQSCISYTSLCIVFVLYLHISNGELSKYTSHESPSLFSNIKVLLESEMLFNIICAMSISIL